MIFMCKFKLKSSYDDISTVDDFFQGDPSTAIPME